MNITTIDQPTLDLLRKAFDIVLKQNNISYKKIGIVEEGEQLLFLYEGKDEKVHVFKWSKSSSVGVSFGVLAQSVLMPIIPHLRLLS
ncbi:hypothetical protein [Neobacillus soli]|uniref:hypothetical protein n=1 Tax=Neobacillus soli TaxID=220688 RepID=UPI00082487B0|nr:hypothetical protein [Neobacillus soli]